MLRISSVVKPNTTVINTTYANGFMFSFDADKNYAVKTIVNTGNQDISIAG